MAVNWALGLQQGNAGDAFAQSFQQGQVNNRQNMARSAMAALVANPGNQRALQALGLGRSASRAAIPASISSRRKHCLSSTATTSSRARSSFARCSPRMTRDGSKCFNMAHQAGIDTSEVPPHFDPQYVQGVVQLADTFAPQPNGQLVPFTEGGGVRG
jgi:hypothetical protein